MLDGCHDFISAAGSVQEGKWRGRRWKAIMLGEGVPTVVKGHPEARGVETRR